MSTERQLERLVAAAQEERDILALMLFGSRARGEQRPDSDLDVCLVLAADVHEEAEQARKRLAYATLRTVREFESFRPRYETYLAEVERARS